MNNDDKTKIKYNVKHGMYGYISGHRKRVIVRTIIYFVLALGLYFLGLYISHTKKNYLTILAVLALLPACKSFVNMVMFIRAKGCSQDAYEKIRDHTGELINFYDMYFTTEQTSYPICHLTLSGNTIIGYTEYEKCNCNDCEKHLKTMLGKDGYKDLTVKIFTDLSKYTARVDQLNAAYDGSEHSRTENGISTTLLSISLA